jgi:O-antigen ligase
MFFQDSGALITGLGRDATMSGRSVGWPIILSFTTNRLVGAGYESFWLGPRLHNLWKALGAQINEAHNGFIEVFLTVGWIGVALLGVLIATGYRNVIGAYRRDPDFGSLRIAFFLATIVTGFTEAVFKMMGPLWIVFLLAIAAVPRMSQRRVSAGVTSIGFWHEPAGVREVAPAGYWHGRTFASAWCRVNEWRRRSALTQTNDGTASL